MGWWTLDPEDNDMASKAGEILDEVAQAIGYRDGETYNEACEANPKEVKRRIKALP